MPRLILALGRGADSASVQSSALAVPQVEDAVSATQASAVIVSVSDLTATTRQQLADLPGVVGVFEDIQGVPFVADTEEVEDFLQRVRALRGEGNAPPIIQTEATRPGDPLPDGGSAAVVLPGPTTRAGPVPQATGPLQNVDDSLEFTGATKMHDRGVLGESIISVVVDTGSCGDAIRDDRQLEGADLTGEGDPWSLLADHGGMTTGIMAGDETTPGIDVGYLPESDVYPIKTTLAASELMQAQDIIVRLAQDNPGKTICVNHSWGFPECVGICDHPVTTAIKNGANTSGVIQVIAAGNQAAGVLGCGTACDGSTPGISGPNSLSNLITVGASGRDGDPNSIHDYSSRGGPGQVSCGRRKPDVTVPIFGRMPWGCGSRDMGNGGGTSAACPQAAGAVGLIADARGSTTMLAANRGIQSTAQQYQGEGFNGCTGAGNLQVVEAADEAPATAVAGLGSDTFNIVTVGVAAGIAGAGLREWLKLKVGGVQPWENG